MLKKKNRPSVAELSLFLWYFSSENMKSHRASTIAAIRPKAHTKSINPSKFATQMFKVSREHAHLNMACITM